MATPLKTPDDGSTLEARTSKLLVDKIEVYSGLVKLIGSINLGAIGSVFLGVMWAFGDPLHFFWSVVLVTLVSCGITAAVYRWRTRPSELAPEFKIERFGPGVRYTSLAVSVAGICAVVLMSLFFHDSIFDPVSTEVNEFAVLAEPHDQGLPQADVFHAKRSVVRHGKEILPVVLRETDRDGKVKPSEAYTFAFDVTKRERHKWVRLDQVELVSLSYTPIPDDLREMTEVHGLWRQAIEYRVVVREDASEGSPVTYHAQLVREGKSAMKRGTVIIDSSVPTVVVLEVQFEKEGVYEIVAQIAIRSDGWLNSRQTVRVGRPFRIACIDRKSVPAKPAPAPPEKIKEMPREKNS